jgi:hypothetical protein
LPAGRTSSSATRSSASIPTPAAARLSARWATDVTGQLGTKTVEHPLLGTLRLHHLQPAPASHPELRLTQFTPPDETARAALAMAKS